MSQLTLHETLEINMHHSAEATTVNRDVVYFLTKDMQPVYTAGLEAHRGNKSDISYLKKNSQSIH